MGERVSAAVRLAGDQGQVRARCPAGDPEVISSAPNTTTTARPYLPDMAHLRRLARRLAGGASVE